jgi:RNA polymerase sigma-70 factor (ECF subfamily)
MHALAATPEQTDWRQIGTLYERLLAINSSPVIALNHAVAVALAGGLEEGLRRIDAVNAAGDLDEYYLMHAARADILRRMNRLDEAAAAYLRALDLAGNAVEQQFLRRRLKEIGRNSSDDRD